MVAGDLSNARVAQALLVSVKTAEMQLSNAYRKLGIGAPTELQQGTARTPTTDA